MDDNYYIVDTDPGLDDFMACALAIKFINHKNLMFTTVFGNTCISQCTKNVALLQCLLGTSIPLYQGADSNLLCLPYVKDYYFGEDGALNIQSFYEEIHDWESKITKGYAPIEMVRAINEHPQKTVMICIGPLTNLAIATKIDPELPHKIKKLIIMGGAYQGKGNVFPYAEFNFNCDPHSALLIFNQYTNITLLPFEPTLLYSMSEKFIETIKQTKTKVAEFISKMIDIHKSRSDEVSFCDSVAIVIALNEKVIKDSIKKYVSISISSETGGAMIVDWFNSTHKDPNTRIVTDYNHDMLTKMTLESII